MKTKGTLLKDLKIGYRSISRNGGAKLDLGYFELSESLIILLLKQKGIPNNVVDYVGLVDWSRFRASGRCLQIAQNVCQRQTRFSV